MCRTFKSGFFGLVLLVCLFLVLGTEAQLNFSPGWGKRSQVPQMTGGSVVCSSQGRPSLDQLLSLYNLIQNEARKLLECQKLAK